MNTKILRSDKTFLITVAVMAVLAMWQVLHGAPLLHILAPFALPIPFLGIADAELIFRSADDGNLTADETTGVFDLGSVQLDGLPIRVHVPTDGGATDTLDIIFKTAMTSGGTYIEEDRIPTGRLSQTDGTKTLAGIYHTRVNLRRRFLKITFDVTDGGGGGVNFGAVDCRVEATGEYNNADRDL